MISEFPLFVFTTLTGLAAGAYIAAAFFPAPAKAGSAQRGGGAERPWLFPLVAAILLGLGALGALLHLHHPERALNALANPSAGITLEAYSSMLLGVVAVIEFAIGAARKESPRWLRFVGALLGLALACITGYAYFISYGVPGWSSPATIGLFVFGDVAMGLAFWAFLAKLSYGKPLTIATIVVQALLAVALIAECAVFSGSGALLAMFVAALVVSCVGSVLLVLLSDKGKLPEATVRALVFACAVVGVCIARYAFYAACPF